MHFSKKEKERYEIKRGDMLVVEGGAAGSSAIVKSDVKDVYIQNSIMITRCNNSKMINDYACYVLNSMILRGYSESICNKATIMHFTKEKLGDTIITVPPIKEQITIVNYLDSVTSKIDEAISQQQKMIDLLNERKQIIIQNAVTKGLDPNAKMKDSGVEWIGEIPEDWEKISLKRLFKERVAGSWGEDENKNSQNTVCMRIADFDYAKLSFLNKSQYTIRSYQNKEIGKKKLQKGDLLIEKSGGGEKTPVGRVVLFDLDIKDAMYANFMEKLCVREIALPKYVNFLLSAFYAKGMVWPYIKATTGIQNLDITNLLSKEIVFIPNIITQNKIVDFLGDRTSKIDTSISQCNKMISLLQERKQIIINDVVTGKVKVV